MNLSEQPIVFIVGVGRSGTSLMQLLVASHPDVRFIPEINFIRRFAAKRLLSSGQKRGMQHIKSLLREDDKLSRLSYPIEDALENGVSSSDVDLERHILATIFHNADAAQNAYIGYKDARLIEFAPALLDTFKRCRIIHIYRDPRDVLASKMNADWSKDNPLWRNLAAGRIQLNVAAQTRSHPHADRFLEIKYEELLDDTEPNLRRVCDFMQLAYTPEMMRFNENASDLVFSDEMQYKENLFQPLMKSNAGKWKSQLADYDAAMVESIFAQELKLFDYEPSEVGSRLSLSDKSRMTIDTLKIKAACSIYRAALSKGIRGIRKLAED